MIDTPSAGGAGAAQGRVAPPEEVLLGRYRVLARRGTGGFGTVCTCWDQRLQRRVAIKRMPLLAETGTTAADTDGVIDPVIAIAGVEVAFSIAEVADKSFKISIRTGGGADASDIAAVFGGGGHSRAAGCRLNGYYEDIVDKLMKAARDRL